jgi:hypothetical protein
VAGKRRANHRGDADRVLVDVRLDVLGADRVLPRLQGHDPRLHVEVTAELLPDDVDVAAEHQIRGVGGLSVRLAVLAPLPLQRQGAEHDRLRRALSARAGGLSRCMEELGEHANAALLDLESLGILGVIDEVAVEVLLDHPPRFRLHPGRDEGGEVPLRDPLHGELLADQAHRGDRRHRVLGDDMVRSALCEERAWRRHVERVRLVHSLTPVVRLSPHRTAAPERCHHPIRVIASRPGRAGQRSRSNRCEPNIMRTG